MHERRGIEMRRFRWLAIERISVDGLGQNRKAGSIPRRPVIYAPLGWE